MLVAGSRVFLGNNENILKLVIDDRWMCNSVVIKGQPLNFVLKWVNFVAYSLYLNKTVLKHFMALVLPRTNIESITMVLFYWDVSLWVKISFSSSLMKMLIRVESTR